MIAQTILTQLGGRRFLAMTGARALVAHDRALSFRLPGAGGFCKGGINRVRITLNALDTYDIEFTRVRGIKVTPVVKLFDVYAEQLREAFTRETGLAVSLGTMRTVAGIAKSWRM
jgi:hypothetical protein